MAAACGECAYIFSAAGPGESTTDLAWDGHASIFEMGALLAETERFWSDWAGDTEIGRIRELDESRREILREMAAYFQQLWIERANKEPGPDLISMMIHSPAMNQMSPEEFMGNLVLLIVGGNDTTRNSMSALPIVNRRISGPSPCG